MTPPPVKRPRLSEIGEPSILLTPCGTSSRGNQGMQSSSNGVFLQNGTGPVANGDAMFTNGCAGEGLAREDDLAVRKRKQRHLSAMDSDIIRLIGQHLREMGFQ